VISQQNLAGEQGQVVAARTLPAKRRDASTTGLPPSNSAASAVQAWPRRATLRILGRSRRPCRLRHRMRRVRSATTSTVAATSDR
jgi:hypothetical protein